jgi:L-ascorbate metabolism protein UlaG (beta-lactamase superfamily)
MFRKNKAEDIRQFFSPQLKKDEVAVVYLGSSGVIVKIAEKIVLFDPGDLLKDDEVKVLKEVSLLLFTHSHLDHFNVGKTMEIFKVSSSRVLAEYRVFDKLKGKIPADKITNAMSGTTYDFGEIAVKTVLGIHRGPIILYQVRIGEFTMFHAGDSGYVTVKDYPSKLAFLPTGRWSPTASPENAFKMASELKPFTAVAMHGSEGQHIEFEMKVKEKMPQMTVEIMEPFVPKTLTFPQ